MMRLFSPLLLIMALACAGGIMGQNVARISITREENGSVTTETREIILDEGKDINTILRDLGVLDELGELKPGRKFEIHMERNGTGQVPFQSRLFIGPEPGSGEGNPIPEMPFGDVLPPPHPLGKQAYMGVMLKDAEDARGAEITEVVSGSPAEEAGLEVGDVIVKLDETTILSSEDLVASVQDHDPGESVRLAFLRDGRRRNARIKLGERVGERPLLFFDSPAPRGALPHFDLRIAPDSITLLCPDGMPRGCDSIRICQPFTWNNEGFELRSTAFLGVTPGGDEELAEGVLIGTVVEGSAAEEMGLLPGDVITHFNGTPVNEFDELAELVGRQAPASEATISYLRNGRERTATGLLGARKMSEREDFRIFHDFRGLDEDGNLNYDFEFDMDREDIESQMEDLLQMMEEQRLQLEERQSEIEENLNRLRGERMNIQITIEVVDISEEDAAAVNESASPRLETRNDLVPTRISFFPNPGSGILNLQFATNESGELTVVVYDSRGNKVYLESISGFEGEYANTIDFSEHADGNYYLQLLLNGKSFSRKLVKGR